MNMAATTIRVARRECYPACRAEELLLTGRGVEPDKAPRRCLLSLRCVHDASLCIGRSRLRWPRPGFAGLCEHNNNC